MRCALTAKTTVESAAQATMMVVAVVDKEVITMMVGGEAEGA